jgi:hypothetical protein
VKKVLSLSKLLLLAVFLTIPVMSFANNGWGDGDGGGRDHGASGAPLDGGLSILLIAGASYGVKKVAEKRKKNVD